MDFDVTVIAGIQAPKRPFVFESGNAGIRLQVFRFVEET